jgi:parallel beta-helix repeat protein
MKRESVFLTVFLMFLVVSSSTALGVPRVEASGTIYIRADGSIDPTTAPIFTTDNITYTFTGNINDSIVVERDNVLIDGAGCSVKDTGGYSRGIDLMGRSNVTLKNTKIESFDTGIFLSSTSQCNITENEITDNDDGVSLSDFSILNNISDNNMSMNRFDGIVGTNSSDGNYISENQITGNGWWGIAFYGCSDNGISGNNLTANAWAGIGCYIHWGHGCSSNSITGNNIADNLYGIEITDSSYNTLSNNHMVNNTFNFGVTGSDLSHFVNYVDTSNTVDGKPIYYWIGEQNLTIPLDAGCVVIVNCSRITIQNLKLVKNMQGIVLAYTDNSIIAGNNITGNYEGICLTSSNYNCINESNIMASNLLEGVLLHSSSNNSLTGNSMTKSSRGIELDKSNCNTINWNILTDNNEGISLFDSSNYNTISDNNIATGKIEGIWLYDSSNNSIYRNNLTSNNHGIRLYNYSSDNTLTQNWLANNNAGIILSEFSNHNSIYHNNLNNVDQVYMFDNLSINDWDDGYPSGGNYWSDYNGTDANNDGIGDTPYVIDANNTDNYPLMGMFSEFNVSLPYDKTENVTIISNSTVSNLGLLIWLSSPYEGHQPGQPFIQFFATGENGSVGFCRLMIPRTVLNSTAYIVLVDSHPMNAIELPVSNSTHVYLYFIYAHSTREVIETIPEFAPFLTLPLFLIGTLLIVIVYRRKYVD